MLSAYGARSSVFWLRIAHLQLARSQGACLSRLEAEAIAARTWPAAIAPVGHDAPRCSRGYSSWWEQAAEAGRRLIAAGQARWRSNFKFPDSIAAHRGASESRLGLQ
ncbi:hypothetical protein ABPG75_009409 [Micractinium tetrahymenae]